MKYFIIGLGGFVGAISRHLIEKRYIFSETGFPINTFLINIVGSLMLGVVLTAGVARFVRNEKFKLGITVGFISSFTTFSTFTLEAMKLIDGDFTGRAVQYVLISLIAGLFAVRLGSLIGTTIYGHITGGKEIEENALEELE